MCLDKLFEHGVSDVYQHLGEAVIKHLRSPYEAINDETTSFHLGELNHLILKFKQAFLSILKPIAAIKMI